MRKEVLIAVFIGLVLGGVITFGIYTANLASNRSPSPETASVTPTPTVPDTLFVLSSPEDGDIFTSPIATLSGSLKTATYLVISTDTQDYILKPAADNSFSLNLILATGANTIKFTAVSFDGKRQELTINLVYTSAKLK